MGNFSHSRPFGLLVTLIDLLFVYFYILLMRPIKLIDDNSYFLAVKNKLIIHCFLPRLLNWLNLKISVPYFFSFRKVHSGHKQIQNTQKYYDYQLSKAQLSLVTKF